MIRRERRYVETLNRRLTYLEDITAEDPSATWDRAEAGALRFALAIVAAAHADGLVDDLHERGKELMRGPDRLEWLEGGHNGATSPKGDGNSRNPA